MADRINRYDKQEGIEMGWHGKTEVRPDITLDNMWLTKWDVAPVPLFKRGEASKYSVLEATDVPGLEIGKAYDTTTFTPVYNKAFINLVKESISGTKHTIVSDGSVRNRGRVFISLKLNGMDVFTAAGRKFSAYLNFGNGHDKSSVLWVNTSNTCTVCDNTFSINLFSVENKEQKTDSDDVSVRIRHTKNVILKLPELAILIDKAVGVQAEFQATMDTLSQQPLIVPVARELFAGFVGRRATDVDKGLSTRASNTVNRLVELFQDKDQGNTGSNRADAFSAITDYFTHESSGNSENPDKQFLSSEFGAGQDSKAEFWRIMGDEDLTSATVTRGQHLLEHTKA